jgi:hypothetical protein
MFELKSYSRKELAMLYFPENKPKTASANFARWLLEQKEGRLLFERLLRKKIFTKEVVRTIVDLLGEP